MSKLQLCDLCHRVSADLQESEEACYSMLLLCGACREVRPEKVTPQYFNAGDLAEDCGVFDPADAGYTYVKPWGWTKG